jgi:hypothetical protein
VTEAKTLDWTFELPLAGDGATGLEDYVVENARGDHAGQVGAVLRHDEGIFLAVERGTPPLRSDLVVVPWRAVREVDHETLTVHLELEPDELDRAPRLNRDRKVEQADADATRVTEIPGSPVGARSATEPGPVDRPSYAVVVWSGVLGVFAALVLFIFASGTDFGWEFGLFVIPAALIVFAAVQAFRLLRNPYERR